MFPTKEIEDKVLDFSENEDKAGLDEYAKSFDIKLDRRKSFDNMVESFAKELDKLPKENFGSTDEESDEQETQVPDGNDETDMDEENPTEEDSSEDSGEEEPDQDLDSADKQEEPVGDFESDFRPAFDLTFSDSRHGGEYANVGYWVIDDLQKNRVIERSWSSESIDECRHKKEILTILYYIEKYGSCLVRESRNSRFYRINKTGVKVSG